jgi:hypothetical protein
MATSETTAPQLPGAFELFKPSYDAVMVNIWTFLGLLGLPMSGFILAALLMNTGGGSNYHDASIGAEALGGMLSLVSAVLLFIVAPAIPFVQLKSARGEVVALGEALRAGMKFFWRYWGLTIAVMFIIFGGFLLLIVPGFFMMKRYLLAQFYMYDKDTGIGEAMRQCATDSKVFASALWGIIGMMILISLPSIIQILGIITFALEIVYFCAPPIRYLQIKQAKKHKKAI